MRTIPELKEEARGNFRIMNVVRQSIELRADAWKAGNPKSNLHNLSESEFYENIGRLMIAPDTVSEEDSVRVMLYQKGALIKQLVACQKVMDLPDDATLDMLPSGMIESLNDYVKGLGNASGS